VGIGRRIVDGRHRSIKVEIGGFTPHSETFIDNIWYPSVSTILGAQPKPWLNAWREKHGKRAERKTAIANAIGTAFHDGVEQYLDKGFYVISVEGYPSCNSRVIDMLISWVAWAQSVSGTIEHTELKVISRKHIYSGTLDAVGKIGKTPLLIDWKTSSRIYPDMALQLAAYAEAYNEMVGSKIKDGLIVHVSKDRPHKLTTKQFKLGKRVFGKFLKLRSMFDNVQEKANAESHANI
jgi:hypothetical protein